MSVLKQQLADRSIVQQFQVCVTRCLHIVVFLMSQIFGLMRA